MRCPCPSRLSVGCHATLQGYAQHIQEFKDSAGLEETSVGYVVAGHLGGSPKSAQYGLLKNGRLDDKQHKKLSKSPSVSTSPCSAADHIDDYGRYGTSARFTCCSYLA